MRKILSLAAALALLAFGSVSPAKAQEVITHASGFETAIGSDVVPGFLAIVWLKTLGGAVYDCATGKYNCTTSKVASASELQAARFASAGIATSKALYTAVASDVGAETRNRLMAEFAVTQGSQYASAAR